MKSKLQIDTQELNLQIRHWTQLMALISVCVCVCVCVCERERERERAFHLSGNIKSHSCHIWRYAWPHEI
jgi:hypothetical protein